LEALIARLGEESLDAREMEGATQRLTKRIAEPPLLVSGESGDVSELPVPFESFTPPN
jgi:hypothetical protein